MAVSTERLSRSVNSFTLPATLPAVLLANPGACVTGASGLGHTDRAVERHRRRVASLPIPADPCPLPPIALVLEPRFALTCESSQNPFRRMHVRYVA